MQDDEFGLCPKCHKHDGYINVGRVQVFYCRNHRTKWWAGSNLFYSWREQTEDEQRAVYNWLGFGSYREVKPYYYPRYLRLIRDLPRRFRSLLRLARVRVPIVALFDDLRGF
jgi:hypothetical protein